MERVKKFMEEVEQNLELQEKVAKLGNAYKGDPMDLEAVIRQSILPVAEEIGISFTVKEYEEYLIQKVKSRELSEDELDRVVGGMRDVDSSGSQAHRDINYIDNSVNIFIVMSGASESALEKLLG